MQPWYNSKHINHESAVQYQQGNSSSHMQQQQDGVKPRVDMITNPTWLSSSSSSSETASSSDVPRRNLDDNTDRTATMANTLITNPPVLLDPQATTTGPPQWLPHDLQTPFHLSPSQLLPLMPASISVSLSSTSPSVTNSVNHHPAGANNMPRYTRPMDFDILSSEQYDDGTLRSFERTSHRQQQKLQRQQQQHQPATVSLFGLVEQHKEPEPEPPRNVRSHDGEQNGRRKRQKINRSSEDEGEDDAVKKARGRPRLDTKDQTAADRRRTQIRMAQRAYRHRKETTISSLEKQNQELSDANDRMTRTLLRLHDDAVMIGVFSREPEFGKRLKSSMEQILALVKSVSSDETGKDDEGTSGEGTKRSNSEADAEQVDHLGQTQSLITPTSQPESPPINSTWGYQATTEDINGMQGNDIDWTQQHYLPLSRQDHQIISRATLDNASFGFDMPDFDNLAQFRAEVPDSFQSLASIHQDSLPLTKTLAQHETTFGRYLQRATIERGWRLISAANPNPVRFNEVFGFCLRFETREVIQARLKRAMDANSKETLFEWRAPFVHLGGSGTFYPFDAELSGPLTPSLRTGMSMGPFSAAVTSTREDAMLDDFRMCVPGFEGEFFDVNDVEGYLRGQGIEIPPAAEFVAVDLGALSLRDGGIDVAAVSGMGLGISSPESNKVASPRTPTSPEDARILDVSGGMVIGEDTLTRQIDEYIGSIDGNGEVDDAGMAFPFVEWSNATKTGPDVKPFLSKENENNENNKYFDLSISGPLFNDFPIVSARSSIATQQSIQEAPSSRVVTMSVSVLVEELLMRAICLGRAPGFRPSDVKDALRRAIGRAF